MRLHLTRLILLGVAIAATSGCSGLRDGGVGAGDDEPVGARSAGPVIQPELDRRDVRRPAVDSEDWEVSGYAGVLSVEDFGAGPVYGGRVAYHVTEDVYLEGDYARSSIEDSNFRDLGAPLFENESEDIDSYALSVGYTLLPGEVFVGSDWARASAMYLSFGVGNTRIVDEDNVTYLLGFGLRALPTDWLSVRLEARDRIWESDLLGDNQWTHNFEITLTLGAFF
jgi:outer membrane beta-barrel protein